MIIDPYKVLSVQQSATNDEIKKAYRELSRKYHPDSYIDNPLSDLAEEKFKEVQEAYEQIMKERENGYSGENTFYNGGSNPGNSEEESLEMKAVYNYLTAKYYKEALRALSGITQRNARWYYFCAVANSGLGNNIEAVNNAQQAVSMEPGNPEYVNFLNQIQWRNQRYQNTSNDTGRGFGSGNLCCDLWCADSLCECMGGDLCSCC